MWLQISSWTSDDPGDEILSTSEQKPIRRGGSKSAFQHFLRKCRGKRFSRFLARISHLSKLTQPGASRPSVTPLGCSAMSFTGSALCLVLSGSAAGLTSPVVFPAVRLDFDRAYHTQKILDAITRIAYTTSTALTRFITPFPNLIALCSTQRLTLLRMPRSAHCSILGSHH
jgi:hypothetical protein